MWPNGMGQQAIWAWGPLPWLRIGSHRCLILHGIDGSMLGHAIGPKAIDPRGLGAGPQEIAATNREKNQDVQNNEASRPCVAGPRRPCRPDSHGRDGRATEKRSVRPSPSGSAVD